MNPEAAASLFVMIAASPDLPDAVCTDPAAREVFDRAAVNVHVVVAVTEAAWACGRCPALAVCREWVEGLPPARRPRVVGGLVIASTGQASVPRVPLPA